MRDAWQSGVRHANVESNTGAKSISDYIVPLASTLVMSEIAHSDSLVMRVCCMQSSETCSHSHGVYRVRGVVQDAESTGNTCLYALPQRKCPRSHVLRYLW